MSYYTIALLLSILLINSGYKASSSICPICYASLCDPLNASSNLILYCALSGIDYACGECSFSCTQCTELPPPYVCECPSAPGPATQAPTFQPTKAPTSQGPTSINGTYSPTAASTYYSQCNYCNNTSPPPSISCNGSSLLLMLCESGDPNSTVCVPCPPFCSFCYPLLLPTPSYTCTCPLTNAPTEAPTTLAPTNAPTHSPTIAPTSGPRNNHPFWIFTKWVAIVAFMLVMILITVCCIYVLPPHIEKYVRDEHQPTVFNANTNHTAVFWKLGGRYR